MRKPLTFILAFLLFTGIARAASGPILVTLPPQLEAVQALTAGECQVISIIPPGSIPENYEITPRQMTTFSQARLYLTIGAPFEKKITAKLSAAIPSMKVEDGTKGMAFRKMDGGHDPHVWLSVSNMICFTENAAEALCQLEPSRRELYQTRKRAYQERLLTLHRELDSLLANRRRQRMVLVNHPAFGYLTDEYGLHQLALEKHGKTPGAQHLADLSNKIRTENIRTLFVQPQFDRKACIWLANRHRLNIVVLDPLPSEYIEGMRTIAKALASDFQ